jgi:hypothetical protein
MAEFLWMQLFQRESGRSSRPGSEIQTATAYNRDTENIGSMRLGFNGETTKPIDVTATAAQVEAALEVHAGIDSVRATCAGGESKPANSAQRVWHNPSPSETIQTVTKTPPITCWFEAPIPGESLFAR